MMFKKISLLSSLLFLLFGANVFAHSHLDNTTTPDQSETTSETETVAADTSIKAETIQANDTISDEAPMMNYILPAIIGLIIVVGFGCYWLIFRRKQV
jgi:methionine-rich copper-binding protein CopC